MAGGTVSVIGGGTFANGAQTAAFGYLFNALMSKIELEMALVAGFGDGTPYRLTQDQFNEIKNQMQIVGDELNVTFKDGTTGIAQLVTLYNSEKYDYAIGSATVYKQNGEVVGFYDFYDGNKMQKGERSSNAESATSLLNIYMTITPGEPFPICFGKAAKGTRC